MNDAVIAVIPARNEESTIGGVVQVAAKHVDRVLVVNDSSTDKTSAIALGNGAQVVDLPEPSGYSTALLAGCKLALTEGYATIVMLDADGAHDPLDVPVMLQAHGESSADLTIGERFHPGALANIPSTKRWANYFATHLVNLVLGSRLNDAACGFRVLGSHYAHALLEYGPMPGFSLAFHCIALARRRNFRIVGTRISVRYDATELACTTQHEFLDLLVASSKNIPPQDRAFAAVSELHVLVENLQPATVIIGKAILCLHPLPACGYVFQRQAECFSRITLGPVVDVDAAFSHLHPRETEMK